jgi:2-(1,2-epoxy-1,2-dihydrophenyl)acetyl-CoA isomerase
MSEEILFEVKESIGIITINRPLENNAFSKSMLSQWLKILKKIKEDNSIKAMILTGNGKVFCTGGSIEEMANGELSGWKMKKFLRDYVHKIAMEMKTFYKPTLAAINGYAIGAGLDMSLMCDFRVASEKAVFGESYIKLGLVAGDGGCFLLPRIIGVSRALEMLLSSKFIDTDTALQWGLINKVVQHEKLLDESIDFLKNIICFPDEAVQLMKQLVYKSLNEDFEEHLSKVSSHMGLLSETDEYFNNAKQLLEKIS